MKKLLFLLLLPIVGLAQNPTAFPYNITLGSGKTPFTENLAKANNMEISTGLYSFAGSGISAASSTTFNVGAVSGWIVDATNVNKILPLPVNYAGGTGLSTPYLLTAPATYVLVTSSNSLLLQSTRPTVTERRNNIYLGVIGHPSGTITGIGNSPDICLNTMSQVRAMFDPIRFINEGVHPYAYNTTLTLANTAGKLYGLGIGFIANGNNSPTVLDIAAGSPMTTQYRTQGTATFANTTVADPGFYDLAGTRTAIGGSSNQATNQRFFLLQNGMIRIQYGQTIYATLTDAIAGLGSETFVNNVNATNLGTLIGILAITKGCSNLSDVATARFLPVSKFGETVGASGGISTSTLQSSYNNSTVPNITTNSTLGGLSFKRGSAADTDSVIITQNGAGTNTFTVSGNGAVVGTSITGTSIVKSGGTSTQKLLADGSVDSNLVTITITTSSSITTATTDSNSVGQNGKHVVIDNGVNVINLTCNGGVTTSYGRVGTGAVTFVQGSGRTLVQLSGTAVLNGAAGSTATIWSNGTTDYLAIINY